jgi:hypothetical protein
MFTEYKLKITVFDPAYSDVKGRNVGFFFNTPKTLRHSMLYLSPRQLLHFPTLQVLNIEPKSV